jgi:hypothetical protein
MFAELTTNTFVHDDPCTHGVLLGFAISSDLVTVQIPEVFAIVVIDLPVMQFPSLTGFTGFGGSIQLYILD